MLQKRRKKTIGRFLRIKLENHSYYEKLEYKHRGGENDLRLPNSIWLKQFKVVFVFFLLLLLFHVIHLQQAQQQKPAIISRFRFMTSQNIQFDCLRALVEQYTTIFACPISGKREKKDSYSFKVADAIKI